MWAKRNGKDVFYQSRRINGKPTKVYVGTGIEAEKLAAEIERRKQSRVEAAKVCALRGAQIGVAEGPLDDLCAGLELLVSASLLATGYRRHDRAWRRRREYPEVQSQ